MKTETNPTKRWERGIPHHPESLALYTRIAAADWKLCGDYFHFKSGGDGDNGETFMYLLDVIFEARDNGEATELDGLLGLKVAP